MNGKGSKRRPTLVSYEEYETNYNHIFRKTYTVEVKETPEGEQFIDLPEEIINSLGWKEGDNIEWSTESDGSYSLSKKE